MLLLTWIIIVSCLQPEILLTHQLDHSHPIPQNSAANCRNIQTHKYRKRSIWKFLLQTEDNVLNLTTIYFHLNKNFFVLIIPIRFWTTRKQTAKTNYFLFGTGDADATNRSLQYAKLDQKWRASLIGSMPTAIIQTRNFEWLLCFGQERGKRTVFKD